MVRHPVASSPGVAVRLQVSQSQKNNDVPPAFPLSAAGRLRSDPATVLKNMPPGEIADVIRQVHAGKKRVPPEIAAQMAERLGDERVTDREIDVLRQTAGGNRDRDIAGKLFIAEETVKAHMKHIMEKLGASDRTQAVTIAARRGIIQL